MILEFFQMANSGTKGKGSFQFDFVLFLDISLATQEIFLSLWTVREKRNFFQSISEHLKLIFFSFNQRTTDWYAVSISEVQVKSKAYCSNGWLVYRHKTKATY